MKTKTIITLSAAMMLLVFTSATCESQKEQKAQSLLGETEVKLPHNIIPVQKGIMMKENYKNGSQKFIEKNKENGAYQGTEFAWIDLDSLKNYIALLDKVSQVNNKKITGLRIYFSQYPEKGNYSKDQIEKLIPGRETIFFAPTMGIAGDETTKKYPILENVPFSIKNTGENKLKGNFEVITGLLGNYEQKNTGQQKQNLIEETETSLLLNEVAMFPPPKQ
ncbi:hypothetical protein [Flavobacterium sp. H122]|uniref:hypothetical protein n=1 Tax=Flavobacterium sp. H122 TaxID=2529860 RepID=UPI0010A998B4|nr:hypothetical protein [Flavobacterium sp. H122]